MIFRPDYMTELENYIDTPLVKIVTGVRRCGKSTILEMFGDELVKKGIDKGNIVTRKYTEMQFDDMTARICIMIYRLQ